MDEDAVEALGAAPIQRGPGAARRGHRPRAARGVHRRLRAPRRRRLLPAPTSTPTTATPTATWSTSSRAASGSRTSPTTATRSSPRSARPTSRTSRRMLAPRRVRRRRRDGPAGLRAGEAARRGPLGAGRDPRRHQGLQPHDASPSSSTLAPAFAWQALRRRARRRRADAGRGRRPAAQLLRAPVDRGRGGRPRALEGLGGDQGRPGRRAVPLERVRRGELRLLRPHAGRHPGAAGPVEARRGVRRELRRRGGRPAVRRAALPAGQQGGDGRARREPPRGLPAAASPRWTG